MIDEDLLVNVIEAHVQRLQGDDCVVGLKPHAFRRKFDAIIAELGLEALGLTPAGLRAGLRADALGDVLASQTLRCEPILRIPCKPRPLRR